MEDPLKSRFDRIANFMKTNRAMLFAQLMQDIPVINRALLDNRLTMIIVPTDERLCKLSLDSGNSLADLSKIEAFGNLLANHVSVVATKTVYPMFTAINGFTYGSKVEDLLALEVITATVIDGVKILISSNLIGLQ